MSLVCKSCLASFFLSFDFSPFLRPELFRESGACLSARSISSPPRFPFAECEEQLHIWLNQLVLWATYSHCEWADWRIRENSHEKSKKDSRHESLVRERRGSLNVMYVYEKCWPSKWMCYSQSRQNHTKGEKGKLLLWHPLVCQRRKKGTRSRHVDRDALRRPMWRNLL